LEPAPADADGLIRLLHRFACCSVTHHLFADRLAMSMSLDGRGDQTRDKTGYKNPHTA
jgi:hypothetical protein